LRLTAPFDPASAITAQGRYLVTCASAVAGLLVDPEQIARWTFAGYNWGFGNTNHFLSHRAPMDRFFPEKWTLLCGVPKQTIDYVNKIVV